MIDRRNAMLVDTDAIHSFGADCSTRAADLCAATHALRAVASHGAAAAFGPVGAGFLAALDEAAATAARAIDALGVDLAGAQPVSGAVADAYADADRRGSRLL